MCMMSSYSSYKSILSNRMQGTKSITFKDSVKTCKMQQYGDTKYLENEYGTVPDSRGKVGEFFQGVFLEQTCLWHMTLSA